MVASALELIKEEHWYMMTLSGVYWEPGWPLLSRLLYHLYQAVLMTNLTTNIPVHMVSFLMISQDDPVLSSVVLHFSIIGMLLIALFILIVSKRDKVAEIYITLGHGLQRYTDLDTAEVAKLEKEFREERKVVLVAWPAYLGMIGLVILAGPFLDAKNGHARPPTVPGGVNYNLPIALWYPFDTSKIQGYLMAMLLEATNTVSFCLLVFSTDMILFHGFQSLIRELKLLIHCFKDLDRRAGLMYARENGVQPKELSRQVIHQTQAYKDVYYKCLKQCLFHHQNVLNDNSEMLKTRQPSNIKKQ